MPSVSLVGLFRIVVPLKWLRACCTGAQDLRLLGKATLTVHPGVPEILDVSGPGVYLSPSLQPLSMYLPLRLPSGKPRLGKNGRGTPFLRAPSCLHTELTLYHSYFRSLLGVADADLCLNPTTWVNWMEDLCSFNGDIVTVPHKIGQRVFSECMFECGGMEKEPAIP